MASHEPVARPPGRSPPLEIAAPTDALHDKLAHGVLVDLLGGEAQQRASYLASLTPSHRVRAHQRADERAVALHKLFCMTLILLRWVLLPVLAVGLVLLAVVMVRTGYYMATGESVKIAWLGGGAGSTLCVLLTVKLLTRKFRR